MRRASPRRSGRNGGPGANGFVLDALDASIIRSLQRDGRASYSAMAQQFGVTEGTIRSTAPRGRKSKGG